MLDHYSQNKRTLLVSFALCLLMIVVGGLVTMFWFGIFSGLNNGDIVYLKADETPFRVKPTEKGGYIVPNQKSIFLKYLEGGEEGDNKTEIIIFSEDTPDLPPVDLTPPAETTEPFLTELPNTIAPEKSDHLAISEPSLPVPTKTQPPSNQTQPPVGITAKTNNPIEAGAPIEADTNPKIAAIGSSATEELVEEKTEEKEASTPALPVSRPKISSSEFAANTQVSGNNASDNKGTMRIQLAAFRDKGKAETAAALLSQKHKTRLNNYFLGVMSIKRQDGGIFWRVVSKPLSAAESRQICDALKRAGQDCIIRRLTPASP